MAQVEYPSHQANEHNEKYKQQLPCLKCCVTFDVKGTTFVAVQTVGYFLNTSPFESVASSQAHSYTSHDMISFIKEI
jgi:hypothetical protein